MHFGAVGNFREDGSVNEEPEAERELVELARFLRAGYAGTNEAAGGVDTGCAQGRGAGELGHRESPETGHGEVERVKRGA